MSAPANDDVDTAIQMVQYGLKFQKDDGLPVLRFWLASLPRIDLPRLMKVVQRLSREKKADQYAKVTLYDVQCSYEHAGPAAAAAQPDAQPPCGDCGTTGLAYVVRAGLSAGRTAVVSKHDVKPYAYVVVDTVPCVCERGAIYRDRTRPGSDAGWACRTWSLQRVKDIWPRCVFEDGNAAERFKMACIEMRRQSEGLELDAADAGVELPDADSADAREEMQRLAQVGA